MTTAPLPESMFTAISVLDSLVRAGVRQVVVSPGSRNAPFAYALAALDRAGVLTSHVRIDERTAGFTALGLAKAGGAPVAVVTTSGTAVGNLLPAVMEAYHSGLPLVVLSADRPPRLRGTGSNQTTEQPGIFSHFVRAEVDLYAYPEEVPGEQTAGFSACLAAATGRSQQSWDAPSNQPVGPVHINVGFDAPLLPQPQAAPLLARWAESLKGLSATAPARVKQTLDSLDLPTENARTVVLAGDGAGRVAQEFAARLNLPLLAEPSSGARFSEYAIGAYREVLAGKLGEQIERVVLFGHPTLSRPVSDLLARTDIPCALYLSEPAPWFVPGRRSEKVVTDLQELALFAGSGAGDWLNAWQRAGQEIQAGYLEDIRRFEAGGEPVGRVAGLKLARDSWYEALVRGEVLVCGSSNLIRDLDLIAPSLAEAPTVYASRGLAGIDGTIATASGISLATAARNGAEPQSVRLICGDLTFLHDAMSLNIGSLELKPRVSLHVLDDCGGGIFATLEHGQLGKEPDFAEAVNRYFITPHSVDIGKLATGFDARNGIEVTVHRG